MQTIDVDGKNVIAVNVPRAAYMERPVYINNNMSRGTFKRNHEGDYHCTGQELKMMLRDGNESGNDGLLLGIIRWMIFLRYGDFVKCSRPNTQSTIGTHLMTRCF